MEGFMYDGQFGYTNNQAIRRPLSLEQHYRPRANRVSKPTSTGNSPRNYLTRRSTMSTSNQGREGGSIGFSNRQNIGHQAHRAVGSKTRPISWHPSSRLAPPTTAIPPAAANFAPTDVNNYLFPQATYTTTQVHGLITPLSQPCLDDPFGQVAFSGLDDSQPCVEVPDFTSKYAFLDEFTSKGTEDWEPSTDFANIYPNNLYQPDRWSEPFNGALQAYEIPPSQQSAETAPPTPDFLPLQGMSDETTKTSGTLLSKINSATEDLVGMGLYDPPSPDAGNLFEGVYGESRSMGKGLKLEETFEPSPVQEDFEDHPSEGEEDDAEQEQDEEVEAEEPYDDTHYSQGQFQEVPIEQHFAPAVMDLSNQSFFFDHDNDEAGEFEYQTGLRNYWAPQTNMSTGEWI